MLIAQTVPATGIDNEWEFLFYVGGLAVTFVLVGLWVTLRDTVVYRKGAKRGKWPTTKVRRARGGGWHWTCWYCNEVSILFPTREAAQGSASQHTDHVERASETAS